MITVEELYKIKYSNYANIKLDYIYSYIKYSLLNPIAAENFYIQISKKIQTLKYFPYAFPTYYNTSFRYILYKQWLILYEIKNNYIVEIQTIINSKQNLNFH